MGKYCCDDCKQKSKASGQQVTCGTCQPRVFKTKHNSCQTCCRVEAPPPFPPPCDVPCHKEQCVPQCQGCKLRLRIIQANNFVPCCQPNKVCDSIALFRRQCSPTNTHQNCYNGCYYGACQPCNNNPVLVSDDQALFQEPNCQKCGNCDGYNPYRQYNTQLAY